MNMTLQYYNQPHITVEEQIQLLKSEGLSFENESRAKHLLNHISMFRLKSYLKPFRQHNSRCFKSGATFEQAYMLYKFDSEFRKMVCSELEKIEVSIRTQLSLTMAGDAGIFWFADVANFRDANRHTSLLRNLKDELHRSDDDAIIQFRSTYANPFPPTWMTFEVSSFGTISMIYHWLKTGHARRHVAKFYGVSDSVLESWLHSIVYVRNICAHHSRLWNRRLSINAIVPRRTRLPFVTIPSDTKKVYYVLSIILYLLQTINPNNTFVTRFKSLLAKYPSVDVTAMGFPSGNWQDEPLWSTQS